MKKDAPHFYAAKCVVAQIISYLWQDYIDFYGDNWPRQCSDIHSYLLEMDLAKKIGIPSIREEILNLYKTFSLRLASFYKQDPNLKLSSCADDYLAFANYSLLIQDFERRMARTFDKYKNEILIDFSTFFILERHRVSDATYDGDFGIETTATPIGSDFAKKMVESLDKQLLHSSLSFDTSYYSEEKAPLQESLSLYLEKLKQIALTDPEKASHIAFQQLLEAGIIDENGKFVLSVSSDSRGSYFKIPTFKK